MLDLLIITGASRGIGASIAAKCDNICKTMMVIGSSDKIKSVKSAKCQVIPFQIDLRYYDSVKSCISSNVSYLKDINSVGIVLCGAQLGNPGGLLDADLDDWDATQRCNLLGNLAVIQGCSNIIKAGAKTRIAFFAGGGAAFGYPEWSGYSLSKVAVVRAAENLGIELSSAGYDASVIAVAPGAVATDMLEKVIASGAEVRTKTDISEPTNFIHNFLTDRLPVKELNGKFVHVRDDMTVDLITNKDLFTLRRIQ
jgi:NAD(P)-dependent dehydrogenase (short-subunit alcohol dehydrogenase family)